jgi:hypothetical protein
VIEQDESARDAITHGAGQPPLKGQANNAAWRVRMLASVRAMKCAAALEHDLADDAKAADRKRDARVLRLLLNMVDDSIAVTLELCTSAYSVWHLLEQRFQRSGISEQLLVRKTLDALALTARVPLLDFLLQFELHVGKLAALGAPLSDQEQAAILLNKLPQAYSGVLTSTIATATLLNIDVTIAAVIATLRSVSTLQRSSGELTQRPGPSEEVALYAHHIPSRGQALESQQYAYTRTRVPRGAGARVAAMAAETQIT